MFCKFFFVFALCSLVLLVQKGGVMMLFFRKTESFPSNILELVLDDRGLKLRTMTTMKDGYWEKSLIGSKTEYFAPIWGQKACLLAKKFSLSTFQKPVPSDLKVPLVLWKYITTAEPNVFAVHVHNCIQYLGKLQTIKIINNMNSLYMSDLYMYDNCTVYILNYLIHLFSPS